MDHLSIDGRSFALFGKPSITQDGRFQCSLALGSREDLDAYRDLLPRMISPTSRVALRVKNPARPGNRHALFTRVSLPVAVNGDVRFRVDLQAQFLDGTQGAT